MKPNLKALFAPLANEEPKPKFTPVTIRFKTGGQYVFRLLPVPSWNADSEKNMFKKYVTFSFKSRTRNGRFTYITSPKNFGKSDTCPATELRSALYAGSEADKALMRNLTRSTKWIVFGYVIKDSVNPEHEGQVWPIEVPNSLYEFVKQEAQSKEPDALGCAIIDTSPKGHDLIVNVGTKKIVDTADGTTQKEVPNYEGAFKFSRTPRAIPGLDEAAADALYEKVIPDLTKIIKVPDVDYVRKLLSEEFIPAGYKIGKSAPKAVTSVEDTTSVDIESDGPETPYPEKQFTPEPESEAESDDDDEEAKMIARLREKRAKATGKV